MPIELAVIKLVFWSMRNSHAFMILTNFFPSFILNTVIYKYSMYIPFF